MGVAMSKEAFRQQLRIRLREVGAEISEAESRLTGVALEARVQAAGDLALLRERQRDILAKLDRLEHEPDGAWEALKTEIEEDLDAVGAALRRMFVRH